MSHSLRSMLGRFARDESGTVMAEAVIVLPVLLWSYLALFVYWDSFRSINIIQKASYTVSDMISREMVTISTTYVPGMRTMMQYLVNDPNTVRLRVSSITYSLLNRRFEVHWSLSPNNAMAALTTTTLQTLTDCATPVRCRVPAMSDGDYVIIVEAEIDYKPAFSIGLGNQVLRQFVVTRPRFVPRICLSGATCG